MISIESISELIDEEIERLGVKSLTLPEVIKLLQSKDVFDDSNPSAEKKFKELLKEGKIPQAYKESGRWKIYKSTTIIKPFNTNIVYFAVATIIILFFSILKVTNYFDPSKKIDKHKIEVSEQELFVPEVFVPEVILDTIKNGLAKNIYSNTKSVESEGEVINYKKEGLWKFYYNNGVFNQMTYFKNNQNKGLSESNINNTDN